MEDRDLEARSTGRCSPFIARIEATEKLEPAWLLSRLVDSRFPDLGQVTIADLARLGVWPHGVYLRHDEQGKVWYVGKATSRSFAERLPAHFDPRPDAWFNTIPKRILAKGLVESYSEALELGLSLRVALIGLQDSAAAARLESDLRCSLAPALNTRVAAKRAARPR